MCRYQIWWIPQVPGPQFKQNFDDIETALAVVEALAGYDLFQLEHNIKPDYANAGGIMVRENGEWVDVDPEDYPDIYEELSTWA